MRTPTPTHRLLEGTIPLFSTVDAAKYIGVEPGTLEVWRCTKRYPIPFIKVGRLVRYRQEALDAFLVSRTINGEVS